MFETPEIFTIHFPTLNSMDIVAPSIDPIHSVARHRYRHRHRYYRIHLRSLIYDFTIHTLLIIKLLFFENLKKPRVPRVS